jgi:hypothetical protein
MKELGSGFLIGLFLGFVTTPLVILTSADMPVSNIRAAEKVCIDANSELKSLDRSIATCKNQAEIPYRR